MRFIQPLIAVLALVLLVIAGCTPADSVTIPTLMILPTNTLAVPTRAALLPSATPTPDPSPSGGAVTIAPTLTATPPPSNTAAPTRSFSPPPGGEGLGVGVTRTVTRRGGETIAPTLTATPAPSNTAAAAPSFSPSPEGEGSGVTPAVTIIIVTSPPQATPTPAASPTITTTLTPSPTPTLTLTPTPRTGNARVQSDGYLSVRRGPGIHHDQLYILTVDTSLLLAGRNDAATWLEVRTVDGYSGWVVGAALEVFTDLDALPVTWPPPSVVGVPTLPVIEPTAPFSPVDRFEIGGHVMNVETSSIGLIRSSGMGWIKVQYRYGTGDGGAGVRPIVDAAHAAGLRLLLGVVGNRDEVRANYDLYINSYAYFVGEAAAMGVDAIEIWNEPNVDREWPGGFINGGVYTRLLAASYTSIKSRNPGTMVISAAPAPTGYWGNAGCGVGGCNDDVFMAQMATANAAQYADCIGLHYNDGVLPPSATTGDPRSDYPTYYLTRLMNRAAAIFPTRPFCFTEIGYLSPEGYGTLPGSFGWAANITVAQQTAYIVEAARIARASRRVRLFIVWNMDFRNFDADPMAGYALLRPGGACPACEAFARGF